MTFSPRYLVILNLLFLGLAAYFASSIAATTVAGRLIPPPPVKISAPPPPIPLPPPQAATYYALISKRDIFNSVKPVEKPAEAPKVTKTQLKLKLWGVAVHDDGSSYCIIEDLNARKGQTLFAIDDSVGSNATVKAIEWDKVILDHDGEEEILELTGPGDTKPTGTSALAAAPAPRPQAAEPNPATAVFDANVNSVGDNQYQIDRADVDNAFDNMSQLFTQIRAVPHFEGGRAIGFRLFAIRSGSVFDKLGLRNGDVIQNINGTQINDPAQALAMLQQLRSQNDLNIQLLRNRQQQTIGVQIR